MSLIAFWYAENCCGKYNIGFREPAPAEHKAMSSEDEYEKAEKEREVDLKERDEFAKRLIDKDKDKQRSIMSKSDKKVSARSKTNDNQTEQWSNL